MNTQHAEEVRSGARFEFGANWALFLAGLQEPQIAEAECSLRDMLGLDDLRGRRFLDVGSGSGLFSLAARKLGATVRSFDFDPKSVACTAELRRRYFPEDRSWQVHHGSILDRQAMIELGRFDVVYSWGVLHHTGNMHEAFANVASLVAPGGLLFIAIYNDQGAVSRYWRKVKIVYNSGLIGRWGMIALHAPYLFGLRSLVHIATSRRSLTRGMTMWRDMIDWLGGLPFEVAAPEDVLAFFRARNFNLLRLKTCGGRMGCNEFVFQSIE